MIPLPGLEILIWVLRVSFGVFVISIGASFAAVRIARAAWRAKQPATSSERLALIALVPGLLCFIALLPPWNPGVFAASLLPALISFGTLLYVRRGNRQRGLASLRARAVATVALASLSGCVLALAATSIGVRQQQAGERREEEARRAAGRANQDDFAALAVTARGVAVAGETSTPPARDDDAWVLMLDRSLALERQLTQIVPADQAIFALAADASGLVAGGRDDEHPFLVRWSARGDTIAHKAWPWDGAVRSIAALKDRSSLVVGGRDDAPFVACVDESGAERWSAFPALKGSLRAVVTSGRNYLAAGCDDLPGIPDSSMMLAGGSQDGKQSWARRFRSSTFLPRPDAMAIGGAGVAVIVGMTRDLPGRMADLWLARLSMDGTLLGERTFGGPYTDWPGGIAVHDGRVYVAAYHFVPLQGELRLFALDDRSNMLWERTYPGASHGRPVALAVTPEGNLVVAGYREGADGHRDGWVALFDASGGLIAQRTYP